VLGDRGKDYRQTVYVTSIPGAERVLSLRQPRIDRPIRCNGARQATEHSPWKNSTGRNLTVSGAVVYAVDPHKLNRVDEACISILDGAGLQTRWQYCSDVNVRGNVQFAPVVVAPEEQISAQASNSCPAPGLWDWAAYIHVQ
jgi:hypothetical protein